MDFETGQEIVFQLDGQGFEIGLKQSFFSIGRRFVDEYRGEDGHGNQNRQENGPLNANLT